VATTYAVRASAFVQYTGANAAEVMALLDAQNQVTVDQLADTGQVLRLRMTSYGGPANGGGEDVVEINRTDMVRATGDWAEVIPVATFDAQWIRKATA
jgi:hypothetical protein